MNEEINEILSIYKQEKEFIESLIKDDQANSDYKAVYINSKVLNKISQQIRIIELLLDPNLHKKEQLKLKLDFYAEINRFGTAKDYYIDFQTQLDQELKQLNSYKPGYFNDGQEFDDAIFDLVENKISAFIFHLRKEENLYLKFSVKKDKIRIRFTPFSDILTKDYFSKSAIVALKQIGFKKNKSRTFFQIKYPLEGFKDAIEIKKIVSRIVYEALYNYQLNKLTTLEILL